MKANRQLLILGIACGVLLTLAPFAGVFDTIFNLVREFQQLNHSGIGDPTTVSVTAGATLIPTIAGILLCPIGIALVAISLNSLRSLRTTNASRLSAS
jgi:biopolymer transport protein ExbB/TolQ